MFYSFKLLDKYTVAAVSSAEDKMCYEYEPGLAAYTSKTQTSLSVHPLIDKL